MKPGRDPPPQTDRYTPPQVSLGLLTTTQKSQRCAVEVLREHVQNRIDRAMADTAPPPEFECSDSDDDPVPPQVGLGFRV